MRSGIAMELTARIRSEGGTYWADVAELPGCFATGDSLDELFDSLREAVSLCLDDEGALAAELQVSRAVMTPK